MKILLQFACIFVGAAMALPHHHHHRGSQPAWKSLQINDELINITRTDDVIHTVSLAEHAQEINHLVSRILAEDTRNEETYKNQLCLKHGSLNGGMNEKAICPWEYYIDNNSHRIPEDIRMVRCKCDGRCFNPLGPATCQRVMQEMEVYSTIEVDGHAQKASKYTINVPVACVCAF